MGFMTNTMRKGFWGRLVKAGLNQFMAMEVANVIYPDPKYDGIECLVSRESAISLADNFLMNPNESSAEHLMTRLFGEDYKTVLGG